MTTLNHILQQLREAKTSLQTKYSVKEIAVFGSFVRQEQQLESDIDILVELNEPIGLAFVDLALELEKILQHKVDLVSKRGIKPKYFAEIKSELRYV